MSKMTSYEYRPIHHRQHAFRVVHLHGGTGPAVSCELVHASLEEESLIPYEALSYTWGSGPTFKIIEVDGHDMAVTMNLYDALIQLRYADGDRILWIDAICINQTNDSEKSHQVQQMRNIYQKADQVIVWLGSADPSTTALMQSLALFRTTVSGTRLDSRHKAKWMSAWRLTEAQLVGSREDILTSNADGLRVLLNRPWFRRCWIIQEIANAQRATVHCGSSWVSSRVFAIAPALLGINVDQHCQAILELMARPLNRPSWWSEGRSLYSLVYKFAGAEASIDRDKIYALLGIMDGDEGGSASEDVLVADYEVAEEIVVRRTLSAMFGSLPITPSDIPASVGELTSGLHNLGVTMLDQLLSSSLTVEAEVLAQRKRRGIPPNHGTAPDVVIYVEHAAEVMRLLLECDSFQSAKWLSAVDQMLERPDVGLSMMRLVVERLENVSGPGCEYSYSPISHAGQIIVIVKWDSASLTVNSSILALAARHQHADVLLTGILKHLPREITLDAAVMEAASHNTKLGTKVIDILLDHHASHYQISAYMIQPAIVRDSQVMRRFLDQMQDPGETYYEKWSLARAAGDEAHGPRLVAEVLDNADTKHALDSARGPLLLEGAMMQSAGNRTSGIDVLQKLIQRDPNSVIIRPLLLYEIGKNVPCRQEMFKLLVGHPAIFENNWLAFAVAANHGELADLWGIFLSRNSFDYEWSLVNTILQGVEVFEPESKRPGGSNILLTFGGLLLAVLYIGIVRALKVILRR